MDFMKTKNVPLHVLFRAMKPIVFGRYPKSMRERVGHRLPEFTKEEAEMVKGSTDFLGLFIYNYKGQYCFNEL